MSINKQITFFINSLRGGGAERICVTLANGFIDKGWEVDLVVLNLRKEVLRDELNNNVRLVNLGVENARYSVIKLGRYLLNARPEKVLVFNHQLSVLLVVLRKVLSVPFFINARNISNLSMKKKNQSFFWHKYIVDGITRIFYKYVDQVIAQSMGMKEDLIANYSIPGNKIKVIHNPINPEFEVFVKSYDFDFVDKNYLLCAGRLENVKSFHYAIEAFSRIAKGFPHLTLKIVGQGSLEEDLKKQAIELDVPDRVEFEGYQKNMIPYYLGARATLLTSLYEGFPNVLVESIALGTPVVAFDCPSGPSKIVQEGVNGYLVKYMDSRHLEVCIQLALNRFWTASEVQNTALRFSSDAIVETYIDALS